MRSIDFEGNCFLSSDGGTDWQLKSLSNFLVRIVTVILHITPFTIWVYLPPIGQMCNGEVVCTPIWWLKPCPYIGCTLDSNHEGFILFPSYTFSSCSILQNYSNFPEYPRLLPLPISHLFHLLYIPILSYLSLSFPKYLTLPRHHTLPKFSNSLPLIREHPDRGIYS